MKVERDVLAEDVRLLNKELNTQHDDSSQVCPHTRDTHFRMEGVTQIPNLVPQTPLVVAHKDPPSPIGSPFATCCSHTSQGILGLSLSPVICVSPQNPKPFAITTARHAPTGDLSHR